MQHTWNSYWHTVFDKGLLLFIVIYFIALPLL